ncbi:MAG TPA: amidohydrolase family protein [Albitalea sp.]|uniref:amidohydrolase family protein n=1 Tax=Piscinibacter sp. TaxID=1903157 RepID=UPI002ED10CA9
MTASPAVAHDDDDDADKALAEHRRHGVQRPIIETHIHFYQVTRPGGVPWPPAANTTLYRDILPAEYKHLARFNGIVASGIVEASPLVEDNQWILDLVRGDRFFTFFVGQLEVGSSSFIADLNRFAMDRRFVGIRGFLWSPPAITLDAAQSRDLAELSRRGMTLDIISRGTTNPKPQVEALCRAFPKLRIIINHLGGAQGLTPTAEWELAIRRLADVCPNLYMKFSSFYDMYQVGDGNQPWTAPLDLAAYKPHFDVLMTAFGPDRLIWGSNWPVSNLGGGFAEQIKLAEDYLEPFGRQVRDKVMFLNALKFYRRLPTSHH